MPLDGCVRLVCRVASVVLKRSCRECDARTEDQAVAYERRVEICVSTYVGSQHNWGECSPIHAVLHRCDYALEWKYGQCRCWRLGVRRTELPKRERFFFGFLEIFDRSACFSSSPSLHQSLMQGRSRRDRGCTVEEPPKTTEDFEASSSIALLCLDVLQ